MTSVRDRRLVVRRQREICERAARKFLDHLVGAVAPSAGRDDLGDVIARKFAQKIVDRAVRFRSGRIERKYAPSPVGLANGYETFANGAR